MKALYRKYLNYLLPFLLSGFAFGSCTSEDIPVRDEDTSGGYMDIRLNLPPVSKPSVRAMSYEEENTLDPDLLNVMILKGGTAVKAPLVGSVVYDDLDHSKATVTVRLPKSIDDNDKIQLGIAANHILTEDTLLYSELIATVFDAPAEWPTAQPIPMWGESPEFAVSDALAVQAIDMHRALARIDVGLQFSAAAGNLTETAEGLDNFSINSIAVYCTATGGYVVAGPDPDSPNIPPGVSRRDYNDPLIYGPLGGVDSYVREIYVPEAGIPTPFDQSAMHAIVVGGYYQGGSQETFYKLDFATDNGDGTETRLPVLRNRRYVFNIIEISGAGYASRTEAFLNSGAVAGRTIEYDVDVLEDFVHRVELEGGYYLGLDNRNVIFDPQAGNSSIIGYQTDLPAGEPITLEWNDPASGGTRYSVSLDTGAKSFTIETLTENISGETYSDTLYMRTGPFAIPILVQQRYVNFRYAIDEGSITVGGVYVLGEALDPAVDYIDLTITAEDRSINGKTYTIHTEDLEGTHGISFSVTGTFDFDAIPEGDPLVTSVRLPGSGTLLQTGGDIPFKLRIKDNSGSGEYYEATVVPVYPRMNILVMSDADDHGYAIDFLTGGSGKVFNNTNNFGPYDNSIVKTAGADYINANNVYDFAGSTGSDAYRWVTGGGGNNGKIADMVYIASPASFGEATAGLLIDYLDAGGVIVAFIENDGGRWLAQGLLGANDFNLVDPSGSNPIYPMPANKALYADTTEIPDVLRQLEGDPVLNGPFGDIRDKQIGEDNSGIALDMSSVTDNPGSYPELTIYSYANSISSPTVLNSTYVAGYKYEKDDGRNMFFWGDGTMMSSDTNGEPDPDGLTMNPFNWDTDTDTGFPVELSTYGGTAGYQYPVYNSTMFCNVMAWAVKRSQALKARRADYEQNYVAP